MCRRRKKGLMPRSSFEIMRHVMKAQGRRFALIASLVLCVTAFAKADLAKAVTQSTKIGRAHV